MKWIKNHYRMLSFGIIFLITLIISLCFKENGLWYDAKQYWELGQQIWDPDTASSSGFRGYIFPAFLGLCNMVGGMAFWRVANALWISACFVFLVPDFLDVKDVSSGKTCIRTIVTYVLFVAFFSGLLGYPLSDVPAMFICVLAGCLQYKIFKDDEDSSKKIYLYALLFGVCLYWMYNIRTIYLFSAMFLVLTAAVSIYRFKRPLKIKIMTLMSSLMGVLLASFPQVIGNWLRGESTMPAVPTNGLMANQLYWGLLFQRYDTYIGTQEASPYMYFNDEAGQRILRAEGMIEGLNIKQYIVLCIKYPIDIIGIYIRHFLNMLTPLWPNEFVKNLDQNIFWVSLLSFTCFFLFVYVLVYNGFFSKRLFMKCIPLLIAVVCITPGCVEVRFFAPLYFIVIAMLCFNTDWERMAAVFKKNIFKSVAAYIASFGVMISVWSYLLTTLSFEYPVMFRLK